MIHNYDTGQQPVGQTWDTTQLQDDFKVVGFSAPYVVVIRKSDSTKGILQFTHNPRIYWGFQEA
jgi:hypothetical protein